MGDTIVFGYYTQDGLIVNEDKMVIDVIRDIAEYIPLDKVQTFSESILENSFSSHNKGFGFSAEWWRKSRKTYLLNILMKT
ncbi:MAG: hypothetical protein IPO37_10590 [Saprospiraceae bacterium]|nr:hypothetical protein [Saprospiraceae bacterium]